MDCDCRTCFYLVFGIDFIMISIWFKGWELGFKMIVLLWSLMLSNITVSCNCGGDIDIQNLDVAASNCGYGPYFKTFVEITRSWQLKYSIFNFIGLWFLMPFLMLFCLVHGFWVLILGLPWFWRFSVDIFTFLSN